MGSPQSRPMLPHLKLDDLMAELQVRLQAVLTTRDRVYALLEAVVAIGGELDLATVLRRIVETAAGLVDAQYGALGVVGDTGKLAEFITVGLDEAEIARMPHWPEGRGLLGELITNPTPLHLADIAAHPRSFGFPDGHPPMRSFLGVPVRIRSEVYGNLYLTEKRGGGQFDEEDQAVVVALAAAAGVAIENARLYEQARRSQQWLQASAEVTRRLLSGADPGEVLDLVTQHVLEMSGADLAVLALPDKSRGGLVIRHVAGLDAEATRGLVLPRESLSATVLATAEPVTVAQFSHDERVTPAARTGMSLGPAVVFPLGGAGNVQGVLTVGRQPGSMPLTKAATEMAGSFAAQAGIVLALADARRDIEKLTLLQDRERIARDLHDLVIQRLYATGMSLQAVVPLIARPEVTDRVNRAVDAMDETIREIRSAIFALQAPPQVSAAGTRERVAALLREMAEPLGFAPSLSLVGDLSEQVVPAATAEQLLAALREGLSNAARHAGAGRVEVTVAAGETLVLMVRDNGAGMQGTTRRSGLASLAERATQLGGTLSIGPAGDSGTELRWQVPLAGATGPAG
jgi:signal transduction histidine kinase